MTSARSNLYTINKTVFYHLLGNLVGVASAVRPPKNGTLKRPLQGPGQAELFRSSAQSACHHSDSFIGAHVFAHGRVSLSFGHRQVATGNFVQLFHAQTEEFKL